MRLLLVDDHHPEGAGLEPLLATLSLEIARTASVEEAIAFASAVSLDVVVLDLARPEVEGLRAILRVRSEPAWDAVPVVLILPPRAAPAERVRALEAGADEVLDSPVAPSLLRARLRRILRVRGAYVEAAARAAELVEAQKRQESLLRCIAHDLKNPIGVVQANLEFMESVLPPTSVDADLWAALHDSTSAARRAMSLSDDVHLAVRPDEARVPLDLRPVALARLFSSLSARCADTAEDRGVTIDVRPVPPARLLADSRLLLRALESLLEHAVRNTPRGGRVRIEVSVDDQARITIARTGLPPAVADIDHWFERYARSAGPETGPGLGLYVARRAAEAHGGRVRVIDLDGFATAFHLEIPGALPDGAQPAAPAVVARQS